MKNIGILLNKDGELMLDIKRNSEGQITSSLVIGDITGQNLNFLMLAHEGEFKESPQTGVGIEDILLDSDLPLWRRKITEQVENEGMRINSLTVNIDKVNVDAQYR
jgi:hypothetical protein